LNSCYEYMRADMLTIWRCVSPSRPDHIYRYGLVWTATMPTAQPIMIPSPTVPQPTASDTVKIAVAVDITSTTALTSTLAKQLKGTIASQLGVVESALKGFTYSSMETTSTVRRALLQTGTTYIWAIRFTVETSLSSTGASSADEFATDISTELNSPSFQASVGEDLGVDVTGVSASTVVTDSGDSSSVKAAGLAWWAIMLIVIASLVFVIGSAKATMYARNNNKAGNILEDFSVSRGSSIILVDEELEIISLAHSDSLLEAEPNCVKE